MTVIYIDTLFLLNTLVDYLLLLASAKVGSIIEAWPNEKGQNGRGG